MGSKEGRHDLGRLLNHQISSEILYTTDLRDGREKIKTVEGSEDLDVVVDGNTITVNGVKVVKSDLLASNGKFFFFLITNDKISTQFFFF